jgi:hypothetical protein
MCRQRHPVRAPPRGLTAGPAPPGLDDDGRCGRCGGTYGWRTGSEHPLRWSAQCAAPLLRLASWEQDKPTIPGQLSSRQRTGPCGSRLGPHHGCPRQDCGGPRPSIAARDVRADARDSAHPSPDEHAASDREGRTGGTGGTGGTVPPTPTTPGDANEGELFRESRTGLDHPGFVVPTRDDLLAWQEHLESHGVVRSDTADKPLTQSPSLTRTTARCSSSASPTTSSSSCVPCRRPTRERSTMRRHAASADANVLAHAEEIPGPRAPARQRLRAACPAAGLVDTGMPAVREEFLDLLSSAVDAADLQWVWLTHPTAITRARWCRCSRPHRTPATSGTGC